MLTDPEKKRIYDQVGEDGLKMGGGGGGDSDGSSGGGGGFGGFPGGGGGHSFHFRGGRGAHDIFSQMFGTSDPFSAHGDDDDDLARHFMGGGRGGGHPGMRSMRQPQQVKTSCQPVTVH